jgi:hypothetical protein
MLIDLEAHQSHAKLDGDAGEGLCRRIELLPGPEKTSRLGRLEMTQLDSGHTVTMSRTLVAEVVSA